MKYRLTPLMVEMLIAHLLGAYHLRGEDDERKSSRRRLIRLDLIRRKYSSPIEGRRTNKRQPTLITLKGREIVALELARIADELEPTGTGFPLDSPSTQPAVNASPAPSLRHGGPAPLSCHATVPARDGERVSAGGDVR